jgi:glucose/mannose-6-phosphate isomerase
MMKLIEQFPAQCEEAAKIGAAFAPPPGYASAVKNIVFTGLGGSAIGADILRSYASGEIKLPVSVNRNYTLPDFVGRESLVIASSYSGNTEETISAYKDARKRGSSLIAVTSGGELAKMAAQDKIPSVMIPKGLPPRCALGYSFFPLLAIASKLGFIKDKSESAKEAIRVLADLRDKALGGAVPDEKNLAVKIAKALYGKLPVIYGGCDHIDAVVTRWRGQLAENSKTLASSHVFPEMNHNEIVGWENPKALFKDLAVILLRDKDDHPRTALRMDITKRIIESEKVKVMEVHSAGEGLLARIFSLVYTGDYVSFYLAILNKKDPTPVERVTYLKNELAKA